MWISTSATPIMQKSKTSFAIKRKNVIPLFKALICYLISISLVLAPTHSAYAQNHIVIDQGAHAGGKGPDFGKSGGIDVLNIAPPSSGGVSHNKFQEYNVGEKGLIINNQSLRDYSTDNTSVLSGQHIEFNRNLGGGDAARIILNEVTGNNTSTLKGYTEIYGRQADFVLANPNGIAASGAGFINVGRLSMIVGSPNMENGSIRDFNLMPGGILRIEGVGEHHFGLHAGASKAELVSDIIQIAGNIYADGELSLLTGNHKFDYANAKATSSGNSAATVAVDSSALGGMRAGSIKIHASQTGLGVNVDSTLVATTSNIEITADGNIVFKDAVAQQDIKVASKSGDISTGSDTTVYAENVSIEAKGKVENKAEVIANKKLVVQAGQIDNIAKFASQGVGEYAALDINNYGQFYSGIGLSFDVDNDFINYRDSALLSGGDIDFAVGHNLVNYRAEIIALGNIRFKGQEGGLERLTDAEKAFDLEEDLAEKYDNPYVEDQLYLGGYEGQEQQTDYEPVEEDEEFELYLTDLDRELILPPDAFTDEDEAGTKYDHPDGFTVILGIPGVDENGDPILDDDGEVVYLLPADEDIPPFTILDDMGQLVAYVIPEDEPEGDGETIIADGNTDKNQNNNLDPFFSREAYSAKSDAMNLLLNMGGRIEAFGSLGVNSDKLINAGLAYNTGIDAASIYYHKIRDESSTNKGWQELGRYRIDQIYLNSLPAYMLAGGDIGIHSRTVLNQSANISSGGNMSIATEELTNQTYSELYNLAISLQKRTRKKDKLGRNKKRTSWQTQYYSERVYSRTPGLISSLGDLFISATSIFNDQVDGVDGFRFGSDPGSDVLGGAPKTKFNLPNGPNGLFTLANPNSKYLVESNTSLFNSDSFLGADYLFGLIDQGFSYNKLLGDPAYETRIIMDTLRNATGGRYLDGEHTLTDYERMQALYDGSVSEHERLGLQLGLALTPEQVASLQSDIIWYVEEEINGEKVLVPQLYLSPTTLAALASDNFGAKISGGNVEIISEYVSNSGDIFAENLLSLKADTLINESNWQNQAYIGGGNATIIEADLLHNAGGHIGGGVTQITAQNLINETKVYEETFRKDVTQRTGHTGTISGDAGLKIDVAETMVNRGADLVSGGDMYISAGNVIFDTVEVYNRKVEEKSSSGFLSKKKKITVDESLTNIGSQLLAAGIVQINTTGDATFRGSTLSAGGDALLNIGGDLNLLAAHDRVSHYSKTTKSSLGGLKKSVSINLDEKSLLSGSVVNTMDGLNIVTGRDTNIIGSQINTGGDANILAGYRLTENGIEKSETGGSVNVINDYEEVKSYSFYKKVDYTKGITNVLKGDFSGISLGFSGGKLQASMEVGSAESETWDVNQKNVVGSELNIGGNLNVAATNDINIIGSNVAAGGDAVFDATNINLLAAYDTEDTKYIHELTKITATAGIGNAYVDTAMAVDDLVKASENVKKAQKALSEMKQLRDQGKASDAAVKDAEINLAAALANEANAIIALGTAAAGSAAAGATGMGTGLYATGGLEYSTTRTETDTHSNIGVGSNVVAAGDIVFNASGDMAQIGSHVLSEEASIYYKIGQDLLIAASESMHTSSTKDSSSNISVSGSTHGVSSVNAGKSKGRQSSTDVWYENSTATAENGGVNFDVGGDFMADGFNALGKDINVNVSGDFTLASKQNSSHSSGSSSSVNAGLSSSGTISGGASKGRNSGERNWVDNRSSLIGTESVDVNVDGTLHLAGSTIANSKDGIDGGNLNITAGDLTWEDLQNREQNDSSSFGFSTSVSTSGNTASTEHDSSGKYQSGSSTVSVGRGGSVREGEAMATIGEGNISVGSGRDISGLNRDIDNTDTITKDMITAALDASVTIDHRLFSEEGRSEIVQQFEDLIPNLLDSAEGAVMGAGNLGKAGWDTVDAITDMLFGDKGFGEMTETIGTQISQMQSDHEFRRRNPDAQRILDDPSASFEDKVAALELKHEIDKKYGLADPKTEALIYALKNDVYQDENGNLRFRQGSTYSDGEDILMGINLSDGDGFIIDGQTLARIKGHENYESKHLHQDEATAHAGATEAGDYAANNHSWANWLNRLGGDYDSVSTDDWMKDNGSNFELAFNNALYQLIDGSKTRNYDGQSISVDTALLFDPEVANPKRVVSQMVAQYAIASGSTGVEVKRQTVDDIVNWSGLSFSPEELEELYRTAETMEIGGSIASPIKKIAVGIKAARNIFGKSGTGKSTPTETGDSKNSWSPGPDGNPNANASRHWRDHGKEFPELKTDLDYINAANKFVSSPPPGTLTKIRSNGEVVLYNPSTNTFAVRSADGVPKTMFKPDKGLDYFNRQ